MKQLCNCKKLREILLGDSIKAINKPSERLKEFLRDTRRREKRRTKRVMERQRKKIRAKKKLESHDAGIDKAREGIVESTMTFVNNLITNLIP